MGELSYPNGLRSNLLVGRSLDAFGGVEPEGSVSSVGLAVLVTLCVSILAGDDSPSSYSPAAKGDSSMMSVRRLERLLELTVDVEVALVRRAILSKVISVGVEVSSRKSLSRKKFNIVCKWTCARATINLCAHPDGKAGTLDNSRTIGIGILQDDSPAPKSQESE